MPDKSRLNFKTPSGLKIRLNHRYFFYQLTKADRYYTDAEIVNNDTMYNATKDIESMYLIPTMLIQVFALFAVIFHINTPVFCASSAALFVFGCIWRCSKQDFLLNTILLYFAAAYNLLRWLCYIALIILTFILDSTYLIVPYIATRIICGAFALLLNHLIVTFTYKKYGIPFNDTELCAFRVFHKISKSTLKMSEYINLYISIVYDEEMPANETTGNVKNE